MKRWRWLEWLVVFLGIPLVIALEVIQVPKLLALAVVAIAALIILWRDPDYSFRMDWEGRKDHPGWKRLVLKSAVVAAFFVFLVLLLHPDRLFAFPRQETGLWLTVMAVYPLFSALPQEVIYRSFYFHRYRALFGSSIALTFTSAFTFAFLHIIYDNWWALLLSFAGGLIFALTYRKNRSLLLAAAEHTIYGCLLFTIGLGSYFYESL